MAVYHYSWSGERDGSIWAVEMGCKVFDADYAAAHQDAGLTGEFLTVAQLVD